MQPFRFAPGFPYDAVVGLDYGVGDRRFPFHGADGEDRPTTIRADVTQTIGEVALTLPTQTRYTVRRNTGEHLWIDFQAVQEVQPIEQSVCSRGIAANVELAKPDEAADVSGRHLSQQPIQSLAHVSIKLLGYPGLDLSFGGNESVGTQALDC